jgi:hypothetical protein
MAKNKKSAAKKNGNKPRKGKRISGPRSGPGKVIGIPQPGTSSVVAAKKTARMGAHRATCSITDPFCTHARGAQRPDGGPPSIPFQLRQLITLNGAGTTGTAKITVAAGNGKFTHLAYTTNAGNWDTAAALTAAAQTFVTTNAREVRTVSFGCVVRSAMSATSAKGSVIMTVNSRPVVSATTLPKGNMSGSDVIVMPLAAGSEYTWRSKPQPMSGHAFRDVATITSTMTDFDWTSLDIEVVGGDTTDTIPMLTIEYVMNVEIVLSTGDTVGLNQLQRPPAPPHRAALAAADVIHASAPSFIQGGITKATSMLEGFASKAMDTIMSEGMALLAF